MVPDRQCIFSWGIAHSYCTWNTYLLQCRHLTSRKSPRNRSIPGNYSNQRCTPFTFWKWVHHGLVCGLLAMTSRYLGQSQVSLNILFLFLLNCLFSTTVCSSVIYWCIAHRWLPHRVKNNRLPAHISRNETLLQRPKTDVQYTAYLFQIPVFNYNMLTENSGHTGISSFIFAHIFQVIPDILKGKFFFLTGRKKIIQKVDRNERTSWTICKDVCRRLFKKLLN